MFSQYSSNKYTVEYCEVQNSNGSSVLYPELDYRTEVVSVKKTNKKIGIRYFRYNSLLCNNDNFFRSS